MNKRRRFKAKRRRYEAWLWQWCSGVAIVRIPQPLVGILDHATFSNREWHQKLYQDTLGPSLTMIQQEIERQLPASTAPEWTDAQKEDWRRQWEEFAGGSRPDRVLVLEDGMSFRAIYRTQPNIRTSLELISRDKTKTLRVSVRRRP